MLWWIAPSERSWNGEKDIGHQKAHFAEYAVYPAGAVCYQFWRGMANGTIALLGVAVLITYSPQNGAILLVMAFLISPMGLPLAAIWLLGKVQSLKFAIQDWVYG